MIGSLSSRPAHCQCRLLRPARGLRTPTDPVTAALDSWQEHGQSQSPAGGTGTSPWLAGECRPPVGDSTQAAECPARHPACMMMSAQADQPRSRSQVALSTHHHLVLLSDDNLRTHTHINIHCTTRQVRRQIGWEVTQQLVLALIMSRLDYCNSMLAGLPTSTLQPLQRVQNAAAGPRRWTTLYHGCARSSASGRSHMRVLPPGTLCPTTSAPWLILSMGALEIPDMIYDMI